MSALLSTILETKHLQRSVSQVKKGLLKSLVGIISTSRGRLLTTILKGVQMNGSLYQDKESTDTVGRLHFFNLLFNVMG